MMVLSLYWLLEVYKFAVIRSFVRDIKRIKRVETSQAAFQVAFSHPQYQMTPQLSSFKYNIQITNYPRMLDIEWLSEARYF